MRERKREEEKDVEEEEEERMSLYTHKGAKCLGKEMLL